MSHLLSRRDGRAHRGRPCRNPPESGRDPVAVTLAQRRLKVRTLGAGSEKTFPPLALTQSSGTFSQIPARRVRAGRRADIGRREGRGSRACGVAFAKNRTRQILASYWENLKKLPESLSRCYDSGVETPAAHHRGQIGQDTEGRDVET